MITLQNSGAITMPLRPPLGRAGFIPRGLFFNPAPPASAYSLDNGLARFDFVNDRGGGFRLTTMSRAGGATWTNFEDDLWRVIVFDTTSTSSLATSVIGPASVHLGVPTFVNGSDKSITLVWSNVGVGGVDRLNVAVMLELRAGEDWLRASMTAAWVGTATKYAVDSICLLPVRFNPRAKGQDRAVFSCEFGIEQKDPITNLRYDPSGGRPASLFGGTMRNVLQYPCGRGWSMALWGYYETTGANGGGEGWMVWNEQWDLSILSACFQSDGSKMLFESHQPMPENVLVGNNGATLAARGACLRPMATASFAGWYDVSKHYRTRLRAGAPLWWKGKRVDRADLSIIEKKPFVFLEVSNAVFTGPTNYLLGAIATIRARLGVSSAVPIFGMTIQPNLNLTQPWETEIGDMRTTLADLFAQNVFLGTWEPTSGFDSTRQLGVNFGAGPKVWSKYRQAAGDLRWWTSLDAPGALRMSRQGLLLGGGVDRLCEQPDGTFYRERNYPIVSWSGSGSRILTVTGTPSADGFNAAAKLLAILIPASGSARLSDAYVESLGANSFVTAGPFIDALGNVVTPTNADTVELVNITIGDTAIFCPDAAFHSLAFKQNLSANAMTGKFSQASLCGSYFDVFDQPQLAKPSHDRVTCYRDHSSWSKIDVGYSRHPFGGGPWYVQSMLDYFNALRDDVRITQTSIAGFPAHLMSCEDVSEASNWVDFCFHTIGTGDLWRNLDGISPTVHGARAVPMYAVVHAGEVYGRGMNHELNSGAMQAGYSTNAQLHRTLAYELANEWPHGLTLATLSLYADDSNGFLDPFDETKYFDNGGPVSVEFRQIRDLWLQMVGAEVSGGILKYLRFGDYLQPAVIDYSQTTTTIGLADSPFTAAYASYDVIYDRAQHPNVVHVPWRADDGSVEVVMVNWTQTDAAWAGTLNLADAGFVGSVAIEVLDYLGTPSVLDASIDGSSGYLQVPLVPSYSVLRIRVLGATAPPLAPPSTRKEIRAAMVQIVQDAATVAEDRVFPQRIDAWEESVELPAVGIYTQSEEATVSMEAPREYEREVTVIVEAVIEQLPGQQGDDALEVFVTQIRNALLADEGARGTAARSWYVGQTVGLTSAGARQVLCSKMTYVYRYYTKIDEIPDDAAALLTIGSQWQQIERT